MQKENTGAGSLEPGRFLLAFPDSLRSPAFTGDGDCPSN
jgi:hypothetical protein